MDEIFIYCEEGFGLVDQYIYLEGVVLHNIKLQRLWQMYISMFKFKMIKLQGN